MAYHSGKTPYTASHSGKTLYTTSGVNGRINMRHQVRTTVRLLGQTFGPIDLLVIGDVPTFKDTSFDALFGCYVLHHAPWILLDIAGGRVMFANSLTSGMKQRSSSSNYLAHGVEARLNESSTMNSQSQKYMETLQNQEPARCQSSS